ncbi:hypothetical protein ACTG16_22205 [Aeromonas sp. 23P]|uniref:hypothetical protein n=1 Tax=Aeromonas sp. 23P TaxID=3452716 RepID=UPI003F7A06F0
MPNKMMTIDAIYDKYVEMTQNASFDDNPATKKDIGLRTIWSNLLQKNHDAFFAHKSAISLFNLILADRRISRQAQQELISRVYMAMAYSSDNKTFSGLANPVTVEARSLERGMVFVWCDVLHVYAGNGLAAEVDDELKNTRLLFNFGEADDHGSPLILQIGTVDPNTIKKLDDW